MTLAPVSYGAPADVLDWMKARIHEAMAAPVILENAQPCRWYRIGVAVRADHSMVDDLAFQPRWLNMQRNGGAVAAELKECLDERSAVIQSVADAGP